MRYRVHERGQYEPPACPACLRRHYVEWVDCTTWGDLPERMYLPGETYCVTPDCRYNARAQAR